MQGAHGAVGHVADELAPLHGGEVVGDGGIEPGGPPQRRHPLDRRQRHPGIGPHADGLHGVVVGMARLETRRAEALRHADDQPVRPHRLGHDVGAAEAVLDGEHQRLVPQHGRHGRRARCHAAGLHRQHDEVHDDGGHLGARRHGHRPIAAGARHPQATLVDGVDVLGGAVDGMHLVAGGGEQAGVDRPHGAAADDRHRAHARSSTIAARCDARSGFSSNPNPGASLGATVPPPMAHVGA